MRVAVLILVAMCAAARAGDSPEVSQALAQIATLEGTLDYEQALVLADRTIARGLASRDQLADLHLIAGRLAAGLDHPDIAQAHFERVLVLRPNTQLVTGTSPKLLAPFEAARATKPALAVKMIADGTHVTITVETDSLALVHGIRVTAQDGTIEMRTGLSIDLRPGAVAATIETLDELGNQLEVTSVPRVVKPVVIEVRSTPLYKHWVTYTVLTGAALIAGGVFAWRFGEAQDEWNRLDDEGGHSYSQLHAIEQRGQRWAIAADVTLGVATIAGIAASALYLTREPSHVAFTGTGVAYVAQF